MIRDDTVVVAPKHEVSVFCSLFCALAEGFFLVHKNGWRTCEVVASLVGYK